jgi:hypothetical protein
LYSFEKFLSIVQASEEELKLELEDLNAIEYQGIILPYTAVNCILNHSSLKVIGA